jgi:hypothetical protein
MTLDKYYSSRLVIKLPIVADQFSTEPELSSAILLSLEFSIDYRCWCFECVQMRGCNVFIAPRSRAASRTAGASRRPPATCVGRTERAARLTSVEGRTLG